MDRIHFTGNNEEFTISSPEEVSYLYFPLASETGLKSAVTPALGGDSKLDQETFLLEPVSVENLHNNRSTRNFWCVTEGGCWSATGVSAGQEADRFTPDQDESRLTAGFLWQEVKRKSRRFSLSSRIISFVPPHDNVEITAVEITNTGSSPQTLRAIAAIPLFGRSADNIRDHRNVTSMLHRIRTTEDAVLVTPTMSFDEKGHRRNKKTYFVLGATGEGGNPQCFYPTAEEFLGEGGTFLCPRAVYERLQGRGSGACAEGREAMGAMAFAEQVLKPRETARFIIALGVTEDEGELSRIRAAYGTWDQAAQALKENRRYWQKQVNLRFHTGDENFDRWMLWVGLQPFLRRIYGCSFLPHHDYGRGGRGWRDLWQDCLSLLLMDPSGVREMLVQNFGGVRIDGTNATIIGAGDGNFIADRNGIARVWMDHALWPLMTTKLYLDQTGDLSLLGERAPYFKDAQAMRGTDVDEKWQESEGNLQRTADGAVYQGTVLEHLLIQHLAGFYEVGSHNIYRLRGADWNDALDMAAEKGESVAFTCAYAGSLRDLADMVRRWEEPEVSLPAELGVLLEQDSFEDPAQKAVLLDQFTRACCHTLSGERIAVSRDELAADLERRADWLMDHIRRQEWIEDGKDGGWFNSYYDNNGRPVEGFSEKGVRMMLTGQVFAIMSGTATREQVRAITASADRYLYRREIGGYRLNTDFHELKFDMGRMFGFAYGEKENGAVFSHMAVMYANALYRRGFAGEGFRVLKALSDTALDFETSKIYPGIPEYFRADGRGMYHYLTGAASWYLLTLLTEVYGIRGERGDLVISPRLVADQFDKDHAVSASLYFGGRQYTVTILNMSDGVCKDFKVKRAFVTAAGMQQELPVEDGRAVLSREKQGGLPEEGNNITVELI